MQATFTPASPNYRTPPAIIGGIIAVSVVASLFLAWLVYYHQPVDVSGTHLRFLPALNAALNALCGVCLLFGLSYIRKLRITAHRNSMFAAFIVSSLFLVSYIVNHAMHGDVKFPGHGTVRFVYLWILLLPHILGAVLALPLILIIFFFSLTGRFPAHRRIARWTYPIWLYVSVSGVAVYAMLAVYR